MKIAEAPRLEEAVSKMLMVLDLQEQIKLLERDIESLIFISETKEPQFVRDLDLSKVSCRVHKRDHVGHAAQYGAAEVNLHTRSGCPPADRIFQSVYRAWKGQF